ncbi:MAG: hypothetical protein QXP98_00955 [Thermoproteus sp.]
MQCTRLNTYRGEAAPYLEGEGAATWAGGVVEAAFGLDAVDVEMD